MLESEGRISRLVEAILKVEESVEPGYDLELLEDLNHVF